MSSCNKATAVSDIVLCLSEEIGVRLGGSVQEARAASFIASQFRKCGLAVQLQEFQFLGWQYTEDPVVRILAPIVEILPASPMAYSGSSHKQDIHGRLRRVGTAYPVPGHKYFESPKYAVVDESGAERAYLICRSRGEPIPFPNVCPMFTAVQVMLGEKAHGRFQQWIAEQQEIRLSLSVEGEYAPSSTSQNVIGTLEGEIDEAFVIGAHHDSAYRSPGANDDASGVAALCHLASRIKDTRLKRTVHLVSFGSEEFGFVGSRFYVNHEQERGCLGKIKAFLGLDTVGAGSPLGVRAHPNALQAHVSDAWQRSALPQRVEVDFGPPLPCSDDWPFYSVGIATAVFTFLDFPEYHQPLDREDRVEPELIIQIAELALHVLQQLDAMP